MNKIKEVIKNWEANAYAKHALKEVSVHLSLRDVARIRALSELYPGFTEERIIADLMSVALDGVEEAMPYVQGKKVVAEDEFGDPIYEDIGNTPRFEQLTNEVTAKLEDEYKKPG